MQFMEADRLRTHLCFDSYEVAETQWNMFLEDLIIKYLYLPVY